MRRLRPWLSTFALLAAWQTAASTGLVSATVLPGPVALLGTAADLVRDGSLPEALLVSLGRVVVGAGIGLVLGLALGLASGLSRVGQDVVDRPVQMLRTIPFTALTPLLMLWFGLGETPKVVLVAVATTVPMYLNTVGGVRGVDHGLLEVARVFQLGHRRTLTTVVIPGALGSVLVGVRHALGIAWVAVIVAETVNASSGIGYLLTNARAYVRTDVVMVCIAVYAVLGLLTDGVVRLAESRWLRWREPASASPTGPAPTGPAPTEATPAAPAAAPRSHP